MKRLLLFLLLSGAALAQGTASGNITAQGTTCGTTNACVVLSVVPTTGAATVNFSGTFSATLQFEGSTDGVTWASIQATPIGSTTAVTSATGTGTWRINAAGLYGVRVRCSTFASGTVAVKMNSGSGSASTGSGSGGSTGFDAITSGTNTTAAMVVDSGASLAATGTGTIDATSAANIGTAATTTNSAFSIPVVASTSGNQAAKTVSGFTLNPSTSAMLIPGALTAAGAINGSTVSSGTAPTACGSATGCFGATFASTDGSQVSGQGYIRGHSTDGFWYLSEQNSAHKVPLNSAYTTVSSGTIGGLVSTDGPSQIVVCTATCSLTPLTPPVAGYQLCVVMAAGVTGTITLNALGNSAMYGKSDGSAYGTAGTGTAVSTSTTGNRICIVGRDSTHYETPAFQGTFTFN